MARTLRAIRNWNAIPCLLIAVAGCHTPGAHHVAGPKTARITEVCDAPSGGMVEGCGPNCPTCPQPQSAPCPSQPNITINMPKELRLKADREPEPEAGAAGEPAPSAAQVAAVSRETLLVPRMVYVPYAPQVPVAPARMISTQPAATMSMVDVACPTPAQQSDVGAGAAGAGAAPCPPQVTAEQFLRLAEAVEVLAKRVNSMPPVQHVPHPAQTQAAPCPPNIVLPAK